MFKLILAVLLATFAASAQTVSYFNQGFLRQGTALLDRNYLGIYGSNIFYWGTNTPWTNNNYVLRSGDIMSGVLSNQSDLIVIRGTNDVATLQLEVPNIYFPPTFTGVTLQFNTNSVFYISSVSNQFKGDTYGKSWWGDGLGLTNVRAYTAVISTNLFGNGDISLTNPATLNSLTYTNGRLMMWSNNASVFSVNSYDSGNTFIETPNRSLFLNAGTSKSILFASNGNVRWRIDNSTFAFFGVGDVGTVNNPVPTIYLRTLRANQVIATNGIIEQVISTNGVIVCTTNRQTYLLSGTNELVTLVNAANVPSVIYRFSSTNQNGSFIITNATGAQTIRDGAALSYTNSGVGEVGFISDGAHWWLASKGKTELPNASYSTSTNTTFPLITNTITLQNIDHSGTTQGIGLDNSAWWTFGVGSRIWITNSGDYMLTFSAVWAKGAGSPSNGDIWLRKNGTDVANTATIMTIQQNATNVMTVNLFLTVTSPSYFDLQGASTDGNGLLQALPAITSPFKRPAMPSIIVTVNKISD